MRPVRWYPALQSVYIRFDGAGKLRGDGLGRDLCLHGPAAGFLQLRIAQPGFRITSKRPSLSVQWVRGLHEIALASAT